MALVEDSLSGLKRSIERCERLADLLRRDGAGARFAAIASELEQQMENYKELAVTLANGANHHKALAEELDRIIARSRSSLFFARHLLRDHPFSSDDLREESQLCREEALDATHDEQRGFATRALDLAMLAEAVARSSARNGR